MSLTFNLSSQSSVQHSTPASHLRPVLALPALAAAIFISLVPVADPRPAAWPGQSCQEQLATAEAALDAHERAGEVAPIAP